MPILQTHRRGLYLIERSRIHVDGARVVHTDAEAESGIVREWNIPSLNSVAIILGQGTSITQAAARRLADDGVMIAFAGTAGTPLFCASQDYRPTERMHAWLERWPSAAWRLKASKHLQSMRTSAIRKSWSAWGKDGFRADPEPALSRFDASAGSADSVERLMGAEGACTKELYRLAARATGATWDERKAGADDASDRANHFLDHGNYLAYGIASVALWALGISPSLPVTHGMHRNGGLVFDVADVIKDAVILPTAFQCAANPKVGSGAFREMAVDRLHEATWLDRNGSIGLLFKAVAELAELPAGDVS